MNGWSTRKATGERALLTVGCMNFGTRTPEGESRAIVERALERGLLHFDTANMYGQGKSERILGAALAKAHEAKIATKVGLFQVRGAPEGLAPERVVSALGESLDRLGRSSVELLYLHAPDRATPISATLDAIAELLAAGRIRTWGVSNYAAWEILEIIHLCDVRKLQRPTISQVMMNLAIRQVEIEYTRFAATHGIHTTVFNPLAAGLFARTVQWGEGPPAGSRFTQARYRDRYWSERLVHFAEQCGALAAESGLAPVELAYGWLAQHSAVDSIIAGPGTVAHLDAAIDACARTVPPEVITRLQTLQRAFDGTDASYAR